MLNRCIFVFAALICAIGGPSEAADTAKKSDPTPLLIPAKLGEKCGYINRAGKYAFAPVFDDAQPFDKRGLAFVFLKSQQMAVIDRRGRIAFTLPAGQYGWEFRDDDYATVFTDSAAGFLDRQGKLVVPFEWDEALNFQDAKLGAVKKSGKWGFIDRAGKLVVPAQYRYVEPFRGGFARIDDAFVDEQGQTVTPPADAAIRTREGVFNKAGLNNDYKRDERGNYKVGLVNRAGEWVLEAKFETLYDAGVDDLYVASLDDKAFGYVNVKGKFVIPARFERTGAFQYDGLAVARKSGKAGLINRQGQWVVKPRFDEIGICNLPTVRVSR